MLDTNTQTEIEDLFTPEEQATLTPFVTSLDANIFGLRNIPEVIKGALFSRYSRSGKSLRRMLLDEFIRIPEADFQAIVGTHNDSAAQLLAVRQAEVFYDRVLVGYGDDSVAELGGAHLACEGISNIAAKALEDSRIGLSPLEKSTRYVLFNSKVRGQYRYVRPAEIMRSEYAADYEACMDGLFDTYSALLEPVQASLRELNPRDAQTSERAYRSAIRAKACDVLRGLLPMATRTNVGLFGNGRAFEYLLTKLYASDVDELRSLAGNMQVALDQLIPSFVKRAKNERGAAYQSYMRSCRQQVAALSQEVNSTAIKPLIAGVTLVDYDHDAELRICAAILYSQGALALSEARSLAEHMSPAQRSALLAAYIGEREVRFHKPGRALEEARYSFDIVADIGAYRDLQRHRILSQERQHFSTCHGYSIPAEIRAAAQEAAYTQALERAAALYQRIVVKQPDAAQYAVPLAFNMRWRVTLNLRELYHLVELRSAPQGHPSYRRIAQGMFACVQAIQPELVAGMRFVDMSDYALERLDAERRLDAKLAVKGRARDEG